MTGREYLNAIEWSYRRTFTETDECPINAGSSIVNNDCYYVAFRRGAKYCDEYVCLFVSLSAGIIR